MNESRSLRVRTNAPRRYGYDDDDEDDEDEDEDNDHDENASDYDYDYSNDERSENHNDENSAPYFQSVSKQQEKSVTFTKQQHSHQHKGSVRAPLQPRDSNADPSFAPIASTKQQQKHHHQRQQQHQQHQPHSSGHIILALSAVSLATTSLHGPVTLATAVAPRFAGVETVTEVAAPKASTRHARHRVDLASKLDASHSGAGGGSRPQAHGSGAAAAPVAAIVVSRCTLLRHDAEDISDDEDGEQQPNLSRRLPSLMVDSTCSTLAPTSVNASASSFMHSPMESLSAAVAAAAANADTFSSSFGWSGASVSSSSSSSSMRTLLSAAVAAAAPGAAAASSKLSVSISPRECHDDAETDYVGSASDSSSPFAFVASSSPSVSSAGADSMIAAAAPTHIGSGIYASMSPTASASASASHGAQQGATAAFATTAMAPTNAFKPELVQRCSVVVVAQPPAASASVPIFKMTLC